MQGMIARAITGLVRGRLKAYPAVALVGPRQCGKTTLARSLTGRYFDLEQESERLRLDLEWDDLNVTRAWSVVMRAALSEFYSHPWAFNEIGFRGPAYPRGYMRRNMGPTGVEPDEPREAFTRDPVR